MPGQKRATPTMERDPTNAPSMAAVATGAPRRSERSRVASFAGCATASPDASLCGVRGRCSYPFAHRCAHNRPQLPRRDPASATNRSRSLLSHQTT